MRFLLFLSVMIAVAPAFAESVHVKYRGSVDLKPFDCQWHDSSVVKRICFDARENYLLVSLNGVYYHYCEIPRATVMAWRRADSLGRFYNQNVKGRFDCRVNRVPLYR